MPIYNHWQLTTLYKKMYYYTETTTVKRESYDFSLTQFNVR